MSRERRPAQCPACGATTVARIVWGLVAGPVPGKVVYGGCCVPENPQAWACETCNHSWGLDEDDDPHPAWRKRKLPRSPLPTSGKLG